MFENIICQDEIVRSLTDDIESGRLPPAILLWGPDFSGKLSAALEIARVLSCGEKTAAWGCGCRACGEHRLLVHPHTLLAGGRYFYQEAAACAETLRKTGALPGRYLFIRAARKLLRRFDAVLWEDEETKLQKALPLIAAVEEALGELLPGKDLPAGDRLASLTETILDAVKKICETGNLDAIPIALLRRISSWSRIGASGAAKVVILENADRMLDHARNSLLKILEEPPPHTWFILTTTRRAAILPTILSRVRSYRFLPRDNEAANQVLKKIFREDSPAAANLGDFFRTFAGIDSAALKDRVRTFISHALSGEEFSAGEESWFTDKTKFRVFLQELGGAFRLILADEYGAGEAGGLPKVPLEKLEKWTAFLRRTTESLDVLNINPSILARRMALVMGEA
jgi:DNA polymerase-3 subunit gamma/tau